MAMAENLAAFFSTSVFAVDATLDGVAVTGIFDRAYQADSVGGNGFATPQPQFTLPTANVPAQVTGKTLVIGPRSYTVAVHEPDGTGVSALVLEAA